MMLPDIYMIYIYLATGISVVISIFIAVSINHKKKSEESLIQLLPEMAQSFVAGYSLEMIINSVILRPHLACAEELKQAKDLTTKGLTLESALANVARKSGNNTLVIIADILATSPNNRARAIAFTSLSKKIADIQRQDKWMMENVKGSLITLQFAGIIIIPLIFYMLASILSSSDNLITIESPMQICFLAVSIVLASLNGIVLRNWKSAFALLLLGICSTLLIITTIGPMVAKLFVMT